MSQTQKFKDTVSGGAINNITLLGTLYSVILCDRIDTNYGDAVRLTIREEVEDNIVRVFCYVTMAPRFRRRTWLLSITDGICTALRTRGIVHPQISLFYRWTSDTCRLCIAELIHLKDLGPSLRLCKKFYFADWHLHFTAGSARWFPEFTPVNFIVLRVMFDLLKHFWRHDICCHIGGSFPTYLGVLHTGFQRVFS